MPIELIDVDATEVISTSLALMKPVADRHAVTVEQAGPALHVRADRRRLQQVILNLVSNAIRFSPPGGVVRVETDSTNATATIHVTDNGPGIPAELLARLFVPFDRLGADAGREGGAGLGLVLARRLTEAMSGTLDLTSEVGIGTHIIVTLQAPNPPPNRRALQRRTEQRPRRSRPRTLSTAGGLRRDRPPPAGVPPENDDTRQRREVGILTSLTNEGRNPAERSAPSTRVLSCTCVESAEDLFRQRRLRREIQRDGASFGRSCSR